MKYKINNITYADLQTCFDGNADKTKVGIGIVRDRIKQGWKLEDALFKPNEKIIDIKLGQHIIDDIDCPNLPSISKEHDVPVNTNSNRYTRDYGEDDIAPSEKPKVSIPPQKIGKYRFYAGNKGYKSQAEACRQLNVKLVTFRGRLKKGWTIEQSLNLEPAIDGRTKGSKKYTIDDKEYTINDLSKKYSIIATTITGRLKRGASIRQAIALDPIDKSILDSQQEINKLIKKQKPIILEVFGEVYSSYKDLADKFGLKPTTVYQRIAKYNYSPEAAVTMQGKKKTVTVAGITYASKAEFARAIGLSSAVVLSRLNNGHNYEKIAASKIGGASTDIEYEGHKYGSINELARVSGVKESTFRNQLRAGKSIAEIIQNKEKSTNPGRYNLTILLKDIELANKPAIVYFVSGKININDKRMYTIGITVDTVNERLKVEVDDIEVVKIMKGTLHDCYILKQHIHHFLNDKKDETVFIDMMDGNSGVFNLNKEDIDVVIDFLS